MNVPPFVSRVSAMTCGGHWDAVVMELHQLRRRSTAMCFGNDSTNDVLRVLVRTSFSA